MVEQAQVKKPETSERPEDKQDAAKQAASSPEKGSDVTAEKTTVN